MSKTILFWLQTILLLFVPVTLMAVSPSVMAVRAYIMGAGALYLLYVLRAHRFTWAELGVQRDHLVPSLRALVLPSLWIILTTLILLIVIPASWHSVLIGTDPQSIGSIYLRIFLYCLWSVPFQEFLFRGYLIAKLKSFGYNHKAISFFAIAIFTLVHVPFMSPLMIVVALYLGIIYVRNYLKYSNLWSVTLSHAVVGSVLILIRNFYIPY